jgi:hypothetical protein
MKKSSIIKSVQSSAAFEENELENFVNSSLPDISNEKIEGEGRDIFSASYKTIGCCAAYTPVNGTVDILCATPKNNDIKRISIPVMSNFLVICTKEYPGKYKVTWNCSLS